MNPRYIYSKIDPTKLLHIVDNSIGFHDERKDVVPPENFLQIATIPLKKGKTFKAHKHIWNDFSGPKIAQESWIVMKGRVKAILYDLDDSILEEVFLGAGDYSITLEGGHNYVADEDSFVLEVKTGPYKGIELDKKFI